MFEPTKHPVLRIPTRAEALAMGEQRWLAMMKEREEIIAREKHDPLQHGYEPPVWRKICDALQPRPWTDATWAEKVRRALGFDLIIRCLAILGGNRSGKTEYAGKRQMASLLETERAIGWAFHSTAPMSIEVHHSLMWKFMPPAMRHTVKGLTEYIAYKQKTGFSDHKFVLPNGSEESFRHYSMDKDDALQGPEVNNFWADELIAPDWVDDLMIRIASRDGWGVITFTPVEGYSATVRMLMDGAETVLDQTAYLLPKDGKPPDQVRALGFSDEAEMQQAHSEERWSKPTDFDLDAATGKLKIVEPECPAGRRFERMPRVMKCLDENFAIVFFYSSDNPFGRPENVLKAVQKKSPEYVKERFYGFTQRTQAMQFPKFNRKVHVLPRSAIPAEGTIYMFCDPASGRNFLIHWYRVTKEAAYLIEEWPGSYEIPGVGWPGPWALPCGKRPDGKPGSGQKGFGFGLLRIKQEIARIEGWRDAKRGRPPEEKKGKRDAEKRGSGETETEREKMDAMERGRIGGLGRTPEERKVEEWDERHGADWPVSERYLDSRAASDPRMEKDRPRTLLTDFEDIGLYFELTPGDDIDEGVKLINDALDWDPEQPLDFFNRPKFYVCEDCRNAIFSLETWTGADGQKGASKDPIDLMRYFMLAECHYVSPGFWATRRGGHH